MLVVGLLGAGGATHGVERPAGEEWLGGLELGVFRAETVEAGDAAAVAADGVGGAADFEQVGEPGVDEGAVNLPGGAVGEVEEVAPGKEALAAVGAEGDEPGGKGAGPQVEAGGDGLDGGGTVAEQELHQFRGRGGFVHANFLWMTLEVL